MSEKNAASSTADSYVLQRAIYCLFSTFHADKFSVRYMQKYKTMTQSKTYTQVMAQGQRVDVGPQTEGQGPDAIYAWSEDFLSLHPDCWDWDRREMLRGLLRYTSSFWYSNCVRWIRLWGTRGCSWLRQATLRPWQQAGKPQRIGSETCDGTTAPWPRPAGMHGHTAVRDAPLRNGCQA